MVYHFGKPGLDVLSKPKGLVFQGFTGFFGDGQVVVKS